MKNMTGRIVSLLAVLFLLLYAAYQGYRYIYTPYRTDTAYEYTISDTIQGWGLVVRDEVPLSSSGSGSVSYCVAEGEKVKEQDDVIRYYADDQQARAAAHAGLLEQEINLLNQAQDPGSYLYVNKESLTRQINELVGQIVDIVSAGDAQGVEQVRSQLLEDLCKRQLSTNEAVNFNDRILQLEQEKSQYESAVTTAATTLQAPVQGYFSRYSDGCEAQFTSEALLKMSADQISDAVSKEYPLDAGTPGKIMTSHNWYCGMVVSKDDGERFHTGDRVNVSFDSQALSDVTMVVYRVTENEKSGNCVVILRSDEILPAVLSLRSAAVQVKFARYTGLRVSDSAVRLVDGQVGVYVATGYDIRFKPIEVLYQGDGFQICNENYGRENALKMFDQVIVKGTDLYDGKPLY